MGSGWTLAEPNQEMCCQEGTGLGARRAPWCPRQWLPVPGGQPRAQVPPTRPLQGRLPGATGGKLPQGCLVPGPAVNLASPPQGFIG